MSSKKNNELSLNVKQALLNQTESMGIDVHIHSNNGRVELRGIVDTLSEKQDAERIAYSVPGVHWVENHLTIATDGQFTDKHIEKELLSTLKEEISIKVDSGSVTVYGSFPSLSDRENTLTSISQTRGVKDIIDQTDISTPTRFDDASLTNETNRLLISSGYTSVRGLVQHGTIYLKGQVTDPREKTKIDALVRHVNGVQDVHNDIDIL